MTINYKKSSIRNCNLHRIATFPNKQSERCLTSIEATVKGFCYYSEKLYNIPRPKTLFFKGIEREQWSGMS